MAQTHCTRCGQRLNDEGVCYCGATPQVDFFNLVLLMRKAQKNYFNPKTRTQAVLIEAKRLEGLVDEFLGERGYK